MSAPLALSLGTFTTMSPRSVRRWCHWAAPWGYAVDADEHCLVTLNRASEAETLVRASDGRFYDALGLHAWLRACAGSLRPAAVVPTQPIVSVVPASCGHWRRAVAAGVARTERSRTLTLEASRAVGRALGAAALWQTLRAAVERARSWAPAHRPLDSTPPDSCAAAQAPSSPSLPPTRARAAPWGPTRRRRRVTRSAGSAFEPYRRNAVAASVKAW